MAAPIVYEGVDGKYKGTLFGGVKFWVAQRVPTRSVLVQNIKDNGGKVVLLEKYADVLIADPARKDTPPGSVSWKYITDSVKEGGIVDIDEYRISRANNPRPVGSSKPSKGTRTPFSREDDELLVNWIRQHTHHGGNKIYQDLEEKYPHHTWQSWRDRWVKKLSHLSSGELLQSYPSTLPPPNAERVDTSRGTPRAATVASSPQPTVAAPRQSPRSRTRVTEEVNGVVTPSERSQPARAVPVESLPVNPGRKSDAPPNITSSTNGPTKQHLEERRARIRAAKTIQRIWRGYWARTVVRRRMPLLKRRRKKVQAARTIQRVWRGYRVRRDNPRPSGHQMAAETEAALATETEAALAAETEAALAAETEAARQQTVPAFTEQQFWNIFNHYRGDGNLVPWVQIGPHTVDFWTLWSSVTDRPPPRDWQLVAEKLGLNWVAEQEVPTLLREAYREHLFDFECAMRKYCQTVDEEEDEDEEGGDDENGEEEQEQEDDEEEGEDRAEVEDRYEGKRSPWTAAPRTEPSDRSDGFVSSPPLPFQRALDQVHSSIAPPFLSSSAKRRRRDPDEEIPDTPEFRSELSRQQDDFSRIWMTSALQHTPSKRPRFRPPPLHRQTAEPETQDFHFGYPLQDNGVEDDELFGPSEQLRSESDMFYRPVSALPRHNPTSESSDGFESMNIKPRVSSHRRPVLPSSTALSRSKGPSSTSTTRPSPPTTLAHAQPRSTINATSNHNGKPRSSPTTPATANHKQKSTQIIDPGPIIEHWVSLGYEEPFVARAVRATGCKEANVGTVIESLRRGEGVPRGIKGAWTSKDDKRVREIGPWLDSLRGMIPERGKGKSIRGREEDVYWELAEKHGAEAVMDRRVFLSLWDRL